MTERKIAISIQTLGILSLLIIVCYKTGLISKFLKIGQCYMQNAWQRTTGKNKNIMSLSWYADGRQTKTVPQKNHGQTMLKMSSITDQLRPKAPKILNSLNTMIQSTCTANENATGLRRICKRSHQPKIEGPENNDAGVILCRKLNGTTT